MKSHTLEEIRALSQDHPIVAFDGVCNLCNGYIQWLIRRDRKRVFRYTTLQSGEGAVMKEASALNGDSILLIHKGEIHTMSDAGLMSLKFLGGAWGLVSLLRVFPKSLRNAIYKWIARNRYKWFGKSESCLVPDASIRSLFI